MKVFSTVLALVVSLAIASSLSAEEKQNKDKQPDRRPAAGGMQMNQLLRGLKLTKQQMMRLQALGKEYGPKFNQLSKKQNDILTAEQKKTIAEARKEAVKARKNRQEIEAAVRGSITLTDEQKKAMAEVQKEMMVLQREMVGKALECLTPKQRETIRKKLERRQNRKPSEKK